MYDANRSGIAAQARAAGAHVIAAAMVPDDRAATIAAIREALRVGEATPIAPDLLITTGGVSVGDHDHLRPALEAVDAREILFGVQIRPGHPLWLGRVGAATGARARPATRCRPPLLPRVRRPLLGRDDSWERRLPDVVDYLKATPRTELLRCREVGGALEPLPRQGSHAVTSLAGATYLAVIPAERESVDAGEPVNCCPLTGV